MKEATGELNMTVITVVAIAAVGAFFYAFIWPTIQTNLTLSNACSSAGDNDYNDPENGVECKSRVCTCTSVVGGCKRNNANKTCGNN